MSCWDGSAYLKHDLPEGFRHALRACHARRHPLTSSKVSDRGAHALPRAGPGAPASADFRWRAVIRATEECEGKVRFGEAPKPAREGACAPLPKSTAA